MSVTEVPEPLSQRCRSRVEQCGSGAGANMWRRYRSSTIFIASICGGTGIRTPDPLHAIGSIPVQHGA